MEIFGPDARKSQPANPDWFTGTVIRDQLIEAPQPARMQGARVSFAPGARTHWHTHPLGQMLHVLSGYGRAQTEGGPVRELRPGDTVWFSPGEKHWHGAAPDNSMVHYAFQEALDGVHVNWMEQVVDEDYLKAPGT